jgi:hypothetical protein
VLCCLMIFMKLKAAAYTARNAIRTMPMRIKQSCQKGVVIIMPELYNKLGVTNMTIPKKCNNAQRRVKEMKSNIFKFSPAGLKRAQKNLEGKKVFKVNNDNYKEYEKFVLNSYKATVETTSRSEYGKNL